MNQTYNRDIKYTFLKRCVRPINSLLIDEEWIKEKNIEMEIIIPFKNMEGVDESASSLSTRAEFRDFFS